MQLAETQICLCICVVWCVSMMFTNGIYKAMDTLSDWLCRDLMTHQPMWVILCHLPEKRREEIVEEIKERDKEEMTVKKLKR